MTVFVGGAIAAVGLSLAMSGIAHAWPDKDLTVATDCNGVTLTGHGFENDDQVSIDWTIDTEPAATTGSVTLNEPTVTVELPPGHYTVTWELVIGPGNSEEGKPKEFDVPACPAPDAALSCVDEVLVLNLSNGVAANVDVEFTVEINGESSAVIVAPGQAKSMPVGLDEGQEYSVKITADDGDFSFEEAGVVDCVEDETPPAGATPTPTPTAAGSTLPRTGSGFPTGAAAALAVFLVSSGGFLLTYRKGVLTILRRRY